VSPQHLVLLGAQSLSPLLIGELNVVFCCHASTLARRGFGRVKSL
jgi:hypothetical protein